MRYIYVLAINGNDYVLPESENNVQKIRELQQLGDVVFSICADVTVNPNEIKNTSYLDTIKTKFRSLLGTQLKSTMNSFSKHYLATQILLTKTKYMDKLLMATRGNFSEAARLSGYDRKSVRMIARECGIDINDYR
jgi:DNA-binding NtrC family response regulator